MNPDLLDKIYEVRQYFIKQMPEERTSERAMLDYLDEIIDEVEK